MALPTPARSAPSEPTTPVPPSPRAVRLRGGGRDLRLGVGVLLVLVSVVLGARLVSAADDRIEVWSLAAPLSAGSTLGSDDLVAVPVALTDLSAYVVAGTDVVGQVLRRDVEAGELLPAAAVGEGQPGTRRLVTVPVDPLHAPPALARGERVDVYVTPPDGAVVGAGVDVLPSLVLEAVLVAEPGAADASGVTDQLGVVLDVAAADADRAVAAARAGDVDLVRVGG